MTQLIQNAFPVETQSKNEDILWEMAWKSLYRRRWLLLTSTALVFTLSVLFVTTMPDIYTAETSILVEQVDSTPIHYKEVLSPSIEQGPVFYETKVAMLKSRSNLEQTIGQLGLIEHYRKKDSRVNTMQDALKILQKSVRANVLGRTQIIKVDVKDIDSQMAADIANHISENFVRQAWQERFFISDQLLKWFPAVAQTLKKNSPLQQLQKLDKDEMVKSLPSVMQDPVVNGIKQERMKVDVEIRELSRRYTPEHPKMKELRAKVDYLQSELDTQIGKIVSGVKAGLAGEFNVNSIRVLENATPPANPSGPRRLLIVVGCTVLAMAISTWLAILLEYSSHHIRTEEDLKQVGLPFLGYLPLIKGLGAGGNVKNLREIVGADSRLDNDVINIRTSLLFSMPAERGKLIMCTSAIPGEGKTTVVALLAMCLADSGSKVLVIDADMRYSALHKMFNLENKKGLSDCLAGAIVVKDAIHVMEENTNLHVVTSGKKPPNPGVLLGSAAMGRFISQIEGQYDKIIFDVPPALQIADALILAERMHGAVLIFNAGRVHQRVARKLMEKIGAVRGTLIGAVINRTEYKKLDYQASLQYQQYKKYYQAAVVGSSNG